MFFKAAKISFISATVFVLNACAPNQLHHKQALEAYDDMAINCPLDGKNAVGRLAYVTSNVPSIDEEKYILQVVDLKECSKVNIVESKEPLMDPVWSPDGEKLAYVSFKDKASRIFIHDIAAGYRKVVASYRGINASPAWAPDGLKLAVSLSLKGNADIHIIDLVSHDIKQISNDVGIDTNPSWSPDGSYIIWTSDRSGNPQIYGAPSDGGEVNQITLESKFNSDASYSPDGEYIVFSAKIGRGFRIGLLNTKNGNQRILSQGHLDSSPSFSHNGNMVIYSTSRKTENVFVITSVNGKVTQELSVPSIGNIRFPAWTP